MENIWDDFEQWVKSLLQRDLSPSSLREYQRDVKQFLEWLQTQGVNYSRARNITRSSFFYNISYNFYT